MIDYDSFSRCHLTEIFFAFHVGAKELNQLFLGRWIGYRGPLEWAARSPDLTPCDFFLWSFLKSKVYSTRPQNLLELEQNIRASCGLVTQDLLQGIGQECAKRWLKCLEIGGFHVEV